ncbi:MAG: Crp/Fnr family transcriptional regulator [Aquincola tertiaricarbonis]
MSWLATRLATLLPQTPAALRGQLAACARPVQLDKGQPLLRAGTRWRHLWLLEGGALRLYYLDRHGAEWNKNFAFEGQALWPLTPTLRDGPADFFIAALEPARLHALAMDDIQPLLAGQPDWQLLQQQALQQLLDEKLWREHLFLQCDAASRYRALRAARPAWCERIPLRHQASWLGITDVSLSRLRAAWPPASP